MANCRDDLTSIDVEQSGTAIASTSSSSSTSLFSFLLHSGSYALNVEDPATLQRILRPVDSKDTVKTNEEIEGTPEGDTGEGGVWSAGCLDSQEGDDELIVHIRFSELVRIKSILIGTGGGRLPTSPRLARVWVNRPGGISFDEATSVPPSQEWELLESEGGQRGAVEYPVKIARFSNVSEVDVYFANARSDQSRLYFLGFLGESKQLKKEPSEPMSVGAENAASHMVDGVKEEKRGGATTSAR
ncbi:hypothetical protein JCM1840_006770 [Sporobolomyces johnsonii]